MGACVPLVSHVILVVPFLLVAEKGQRVLCKEWAAGEGTLPLTLFDGSETDDPVNQAQRESPRECLCKCC